MIGPVCKVSTSICPDCFGTGIDQDPRFKDDKLMCLRCKGKGTIVSESKVMCIYCAGRGKDQNNICVHCNGSGYNNLVE